MDLVLAACFICKPAVCLYRAHELHKTQLTTLIRESVQKLSICLSLAHPYYNVTRQRIRKLQTAIHQTPTLEHQILSLHTMHTPTKHGLENMKLFFFNICCKIQDCFTLFLLILLIEINIISSAHTHTFLYPVKIPIILSVS